MKQANKWAVGANEWKQLTYYSCPDSLLFWTAVYRSLFGCNDCPPMRQGFFFFFYRCEDASKNCTSLHGLDQVTLFFWLTPLSIVVSRNEQTHGKKDKLTNKGMDTTFKRDAHVYLKPVMKISITERRSLKMILTLKFMFLH